MEKYSFPILSPSDIYSHLKNSLRLNISSEEDITKPKFESVKEIYVQLLEVVLQKSREELLKPQPEHLRILKNPELYEQATPAISLFKYISKVTQRIGCKEDQFKIQDLLSPDFRRTRKFISAFLNYIKFMTEEQEIIYDQNQECVVSRAAADELHKAKEEYDKLQNEVQYLKKKREDQQPLISQKQTRIQELEREKHKLQEEKQSIENEIQHLQVEIAGCEEAKLQIENMRHNVKEETQEAQNRIVQSPERVKRPLEELKAQLLSEQNNMEDEQNSLTELTHKFEMMEGVVEKLKEAKLMLDHCDVTMNKYKELKRQVAQQKQRGMELDNEIKQKQLSLNLLDQELKGYNDRVFREQKTNESKLFTLEKAVEEKKEQLNYFLQEKKALDEQIAEKKSQVSKLETDIENKKAEHEAQMQTLASEHEVIVKKAQEYQQQVTNMISNSEVFQENKENFFNK
mmetsp:Transcript_9871/g.14733  ORF Transcript_9871/g.14733 Transcript_9871/m.14733 type:complete len:459 (+) Transcript_9871:22-1398(+)